MSNANGKVLPLAARDVWLTVMERAGWRCQCDRPHPKHRQCRPGCDRKHAHRSDQRCHVEHRDNLTHLIAGPAQPGPDPARTLATIDPAELIAWCQVCWDIEVAAARRTQRAETQARLADQSTLF
jgi:hypothetical protein